MDQRQHRRLLAQAREAFLARAEPPAVRDIVLDSWKRSLSSGLDPEAAVDQPTLSEQDLIALQAAHPLGEFMPLIRQLLVEGASEAGMLVAVSDAAGRLLWVEGDRGLRSRAESMLFVPGATWSEQAVGTNAPGTALALDQAVQIRAAEHLARQVTRWSCSAAPIHDPETGAMLGVLDLTGDDDAANPQSLSMVRATVAAVEAQLRLARLSRWADLSTYAVPALSLQRHLQVLGARAGLLTEPHGVRRLSLRHSELLLLLSLAPDGLTTEEIAVALSDREIPAVTVRAELSRLRAVLGDETIASRPYRIAGPLTTDLAHLREVLTHGSVAEAAQAYRGPLLPTSESPAISELRDELHMQVRGAVLRSADPDVLLRFADTDFGRDDLELWEVARRRLPADSPRMVSVEARIHALSFGDF
ncbi:GAF domain-containing protein [Branchiibius hedensis]|uniref:GAF domain-containing protein n=1 Tax=Branchiibius hedensis TaxID=672460 RepID=UPI001B8856CB|nr:GAF domain-containing protein [Branchiibius hedensis]